MTLFDMKGKVAVITGSTRGIGRAIAERMAEHGAKVVISSRKQDVRDKVTKEINDKFGKGSAASIAANISSKENLQHLVDESNRAFGSAIRLPSAPPMTTSEPADMATPKQMVCTSQGTYCMVS